MGVLKCNHDGPYETLSASGDYELHRCLLCYRVYGYSPEKPEVQSEAEARRLEPFARFLATLPANGAGGEWGEEDVPKP